MGKIGKVQKVCVKQAKSKKRCRSGSILAGKDVGAS